MIKVFRGFDRLSFLGVGLTLVGALIIIRMINIQKEGQFLVDEAFYTEVVKPDRGIIYDRDGHVLAGNKLVYEVGIELNQVDPINGAETIAQETARILGLDYAEVKELASRAFDPVSARYLVIGDFIEPDKILQMSEVKNQRLLAYDTSLNGLYWFPHLQRSYPEENLASNILGFYAFWDRMEGKPHFGIEEEYNDMLAGDPKKVTYQLDPSQITEIPEIPPGANIVLTIDREIQSMAERIIDHETANNGAVSGTILIMDPETGEILAMAVTPRINPNEYEKSGGSLTEEYSYNRVIDINYEPGSVFKVITMAAALDANVVETDTKFLDEGYISVGGYTIYNWDRSAWGPQTMLGCMQHSLNVCLSWIAVEKLGAEKFYDYLNRFGIGHRTNIDLAGERVYPVSEPGDSYWSDVSLATNSFGQGLAITPIQLVSAISAVANDGKIMAPHVLKEVVSPEMNITIQPRVVANPISAETAHDLTEMLAVSLEEEASNSLVDGYRVSGKTGTAEIAVGNTGYSTQLTNASFIGWGPSDDPKFIVFVWLEKPTSSKWGSVVAAPIFRKVVTELVVLMDLPPDSVREQLASELRITMLKLSDVLEALTGAKPANASMVISEAAVDSRLVLPAGMFIALPGERSDGHDHIGQVFEMGARLAIIDKDRAGGYPVVDLTGTVLPGDIRLPEGPFCLKVDDSLAALQKIAGFWRSKLNLKVTGITGSIGKSTTKELTSEVLAQRFRTLKSRGNLNNEIGLPLSLLRLGTGHQQAVMEMGFYLPGEIRFLCELAKPAIGVVTNVGPVHVARAGSVQEIANGKAELVEALPQDGVAILNFDDPLVKAMSSRTAARVFFYGMDPAAHLWASHVEGLGLGGIRLQLHYQKEILQLQVPLIGRHSAYTVLRAASVGLMNGLTWQEILNGLQKGRSQMRLVAVRTKNGAMLLDDSYNSSPESCVAALDLLDEMEGRKIAVLGDMLELGSFEESGHIKVGQRVAEVCDELVAVGERSRIIVDAAQKAGLPEEAINWFAKVPQVAEFLETHLVPGDIALVKGSLGMAMSRIVTALESSHD